MDEKRCNFEELTEDLIENVPWARDMYQRALSIASKGVLNWIKVTMKIGESGTSRQEWIDVFLKQGTKVYLEMFYDIDLLQEKMLDQIEASAHRLINLQKELNVEQASEDYEKMTLYEVQGLLNTKIMEYEAIIDGRKQEYQALKVKYLQNCKILGKEPKLRLEHSLPSMQELEDIKVQIEELENEKFRREEKFLQLKVEIIDIVKELNLIPSLDFEKKLLSTNDAIVMVTDEDMKQLNTYYETLKKQSKNVKEEISTLRGSIDILWNKLEIPIIERNTFLKLHTGNSLDTLEALKNELKRLNILKMANIKIFVDKLKQELTDLWTKCVCSDEDKHFQYLNNELYTEDLLDIFELEVNKWKLYYEENRELFHLIEEHGQLWSKLELLELNAEGPNRYKNRGGQLLREEKERNHLMKRIPKVEEKLLKLSELFFTIKQREFLVFGKTITEYINDIHEHREIEKKHRLSAKKQQREQLLKLTPGKSGQNLFSANSMQNLRLTPYSVKRRLLTPATDVPKRQKVNCTLKKTKSVTCKSKRKSRELMKERLERRKRLSQKMAKEREENPILVNRNIGNMPKIIVTAEQESGNTTIAEYDDFEKEITTKEYCRSSIMKGDEILAIPLPKTPLHQIENKIILQSPNTNRNLAGPYVTTPRPRN